MKMLKKILMYTVLFLNHPVRMAQAVLVCWLMEARQAAYIVRARRASVPKAIAGLYSILSMVTYFGVACLVVLSPALLRVFTEHDRAAVLEDWATVPAFCFVMVVLLAAVILMSTVLMPCYFLCMVPCSDEQCRKSLKLARNLFIGMQLLWPVMTIAPVWTPWNGTELLSDLVTVVAVNGMIFAMATFILLVALIALAQGIYCLVRWFGARKKHEENRLSI